MLQRQEGGIKIEISKVMQLLIVAKAWCNHEGTKHYSGRRSLEPERQETEKLEKKEQKLLVSHCNCAQLTAG